VDTALCHVVSSNADIAVRETRNETSLYGGGIVLRSTDGQRCERCHTRDDVPPGQLEVPSHLDTQMHEKELSDYG
jgi:hypothetical protein